VIRVLILNTFFYDPDHPVRYATHTLDPNHRKIALYVPLVDDYDLNTKGHGIHVSGIVGGQALNSSMAVQYNVGLRKGIKGFG
jgi:hypothetical protein